MAGKKLLSSKEVLHIARLAQLRLTKAEVRKFQKQLSDIIRYVSQINQVLVKGKTPPPRQIIGLKNVFRPDVPGQPLSRQQALKNAPEKHQGYFKTKPIFDEA